MGDGMRGEGEFARFSDAGKGFASQSRKNLHITVERVYYGNYIQPVKFSAFLPTLLMAAAIWIHSAGNATAGPETWEPVNGVIPAGGFVVDMQSRIESLAFYNAVFLASEGAEYRIGWTGSYGGTCASGNTAQLFKDDVRRRVNYYRALCGLPAAISFDADLAGNSGPAGSPQVSATTTKRAAAQASAYLNAFSNVFFDNFALTHSPIASNSACYSNTAWNGSWHSNLTIGYFGPKAIDVYMADDDLNDDQANNANVGHRRWILYSRARDMSSGDVPRSTYSDASGTYPVLPANALYVTGVFASAASSPKNFVTWPPAGYVPLPLKPLRWSVSYPGATFVGAASAITLRGPDGNVIPVSVLSHNQTTLGDNTLVFQPSQTNVTGTADATFTVTITGMGGTGVPASHTWQTTFFDPAELGLTQTLSGPAQPRPSGSDYQFNAAPLAGSYQVLVNTRGNNLAYVENGEAAVPDIVTEKTGTYPVLQEAASLGGLSFVPRSGSRSLHLCFPLDESEIDYLPHPQAFMLGPEFIPSTSSTLSFQELFRWLFTTNRVSAEISTDGGNRWAEIYGRNGAFSYAVGASYSSSGWDPVWRARSISLAPWAGKTVRLRFILRPGAISFDGPDINHGCYLDDITLSDVSRLSPGALNTQADTSFKLNQASAGTPLVAGSSYLLRVRSRIGTRYMGYSGALTVVPAPPSGFETAFPALAVAPLGDSDQDGIPNLIEYGLGLNPQSPNQASVLPQPVLTDSGLTLGFTVPPGINDLDYTAECTTDFNAWLPVTNVGSAHQPVFTVPLGTGPRSFLRLRISQQP